VPAQDHSSSKATLHRPSRSWGQRLLPADWHEKLQVGRYPIKQFIRQQFLPRLKSGDRVLDAGSGKLDEQTMRAELLATGAHLETLDFIPGEGIDHVADVADTKLPAQSYDALLCVQVLEHVPDPARVCHELFRLCKPGGWVVVTAPQSGRLHNLPHHYFHFTNIAMRKLLTDAGFEVLALEPQGGHFLLLAEMGHLTCRVLDRCATTPLRRILLLPFRVWTRFWHGLVKRAFYCWLDRRLFFPNNTQGWSALCRRPGAR